MCALRDSQRTSKGWFVRVSLDRRPFWAGAASGPGLQQLCWDQERGGEIKRDRWERGGTGRGGGFFWAAAMPSSCPINLCPRQRERLAFAFHSPVVSPICTLPSPTPTPHFYTGAVYFQPSTYSEGLWSNYFIKLHLCCQRWPQLART